MRDLQKDLEFIQASTPKPHEMWPGGQWGYFILEAIEGWSEAVRRAMGAEARIEKLEGQIKEMKAETIPAAISERCRKYGQQCCHICEDADCGDNITPSILALKKRVLKAEAEIEQLRVQLAGCSVAALGCDKGNLKPGDYGYSTSYQDVVGLRQRAMEAEARIIELENEIMLIGSGRPRPIEFFESDGTKREIVYDFGDESAGFWPGWTVADDDTAWEDKIEQIEKMREALGAARHELTTLHGLIAFDAATPNERLVITTNKTVDMIDRALEGLEKKETKQFGRKNEPK